jgi:pimeloyl-ACP methyl ester carboxylesterase
MVQANGVDLCVETFGDRGDPAVLLITGASASMDWWEDAFCERVAGGSRHVIRYDQRDTGRSATDPPGAPTYGVGDLRDDAVGVLDALGVGAAHIVGISMDGGIAQLVALDHPDRVASLTLIATAPSAPGADDPDLPGMSEEAAARFLIEAPADWSDRAAVVDYCVGLSRATLGDPVGFDEAAARALCARMFDRTTNMASTYTNHHRLAGPGRWRERLPGLSVPTLVVHGTQDVVVPYGNGLALEREIAEAKLLTLNGGGHVLLPSDWDVVIPALLAHTS